MVKYCFFYFLAVFCFCFALIFWWQIKEIPKFSTSFNLFVGVFDWILYYNANARNAKIWRKKIALRQSSIDGFCFLFIFCIYLFIASLKSSVARFQHTAHCFFFFINIISFFGYFSTFLDLYYASWSIDMISQYISLSLTLSLCL